MGIERGLTALKCAIAGHKYHRSVCISLYDLKETVKYEISRIRGEKPESSVPRGAYHGDFLARGICARCGEYVDEVTPEIEKIVKQIALEDSALSSSENNLNSYIIGAVRGKWKIFGKS